MGFASEGAGRSQPGEPRRTRKRYFSSSEGSNHSVTGNRGGGHRPLFAAYPIAVRADNVEAFAGGQADFANGRFRRRECGWPGSSIVNGLAFRGYFDTGGYDYVRHDLGVIRANFSGEELDAVYGITLKHIWNDLGVGVNATYTGLSPDYSKNRRQATKRSFG